MHALTLYQSTFWVTRFSSAIDNEADLTCHRDCDPATGPPRGEVVHVSERFGRDAAIASQGECHPRGAKIHKSAGWGWRPGSVAGQREAARPVVLSLVNPSVGRRQELGAGQPTFIFEHTRACSAPASHRSSWPACRPVPTRLRCRTFSLPR